ncbi:U3 snoRNP protein [Sporothrix eucalyptigena]|uniref:U3 snoRNP protein n=1 Tax=Sporothrix eucalyptigena TaxID=1812306 RepID=A0ABP0B3R0_9PEZI
MARVDDKARYYLERAVPQLREFESKEIFSKDEIRTLVQKRTEYERLILSPGSSPADVLAYISWDRKLDDLRAKRCRRLKIKQSTSFTSQNRIFQTFERGVTKHPGSKELWRAYLEFAAQERATKRWRRIMTCALRMLPSDSGLWVVAGRRAAADGDMEGARSLFMRGCRFCTSEPLVWVEYARVEMEWLARLEKKRGTAAFNLSVAAIAAEAANSSSDKKKSRNVYEEGEGMALFDSDDEDGEGGDGDDDDGGDFSNAAILPKSLVADPLAKNKKPVFSDEMVRKLAATPALEGAIPKAIFDAAAKQPFFNADAAEAFFDLFAHFCATVPTAQPMLNAHVLTDMDTRYPKEAATWNCRAKSSVLGLNPNHAAFPRALGAALKFVREGLFDTTNKVLLAAKTRAWIDVLLARTEDGLDASLRAVLEDTRRKLDRVGEAQVIKA